MGTVFRVLKAGKKTKRCKCVTTALPVYTSKCDIFLNIAMKVIQL